MPRVVLTIGGSDSGGGAGIQADIKTFSALGLHGTSVIAAVTSQNTLGVQAIYGMEAEAVSAQLRSVTDDFHIDFAKTGMLYSAEIVMEVAAHLAETEIPLVLDPVIEAEAGGRLLRPEAVDAVKENLMPLAHIVTPNIFEAQALTGIAVRDAASAEIAAHKILDLGANAVMIKGGHLDCTDFLLDERDFYQIQGKRVKGGNHGVGCTYSAALTSFLAKGHPLRKAASEAKSFAAQAISNSLDVGRGVAPVGQTGALLKEAHKFRAFSDVQKAIELLERSGIEHIVPKTGSSIIMAIPDAATSEDIAGGMIIHERRAGVHQSCCIKFGVESLLTRVLLSAASTYPNARAAMSLKIDAKSAKASGLKLISIQGMIIENFIITEDTTLRALKPAAMTDETEDASSISEIGYDEHLSVLIGTDATDVAAAAIRLARLLDHSDGKL